MLRLRTLLLLAVLSSSNAYPQMSTGHHQSASKSPVPRSLRERYETLVCAIALITTDAGTGTGFFVDASGNMVTAAHVVSTKDFFRSPQGLNTHIHMQSNIRVTPHGGVATPITVSAKDIIDNANYDLARFATGLKPPCWIPLGKAESVKTGDELWSIGFPGIDNGNDPLQRLP